MDYRQGEKEGRGKRRRRGQERSGRGQEGEGKIGFEKGKMVKSEEGWEGDNKNLKIKVSKQRRDMS
jgi:hypothetical protein